MTYTELTLHQRMQNALQYIQNSLDQALDPEEIAAQAHFSLSHFHRIFKGMIGETLGEHVRRLRLERSAQLLIYSDRPITTIAFDAGYETLESFSRAFKKMFGSSPSHFREELRELKFPDSPSGIHYNPGATLGLPNLSQQDHGLEMRFAMLDPMRIASIRHTGPYQECGMAWKRLCDWACPKGIFNETTMFLGICYDDPAITPADKIRMEVSVTVPDHIQPEGEIAIRTVPGGEYAVVTHHGPYHLLEETYSRFCGRWLPASGREIRNQPGMEHYITNPEVTAPEDLITDLYIPLV
ncbi:AraC family transcriptional regulator [Salidesulfovibrio onnuriiensis]|uniref:AraC family transcriptional regulator n=1 Tax=Salidesulfovibrio onnuriiensis TaxID=2583823 RepID=UPI0016509F18|nr:AraC family transcriptional regulator [Salidesulfovibrio onnuriiensis]